MMFPSFWQSFNPRAREGRDSGKTSNQSPVFCFNPRAREGRDTQSDRFCGHDHHRFNPRAREGRDFQVVKRFHVKRRFNPRAREGRDRRENKLLT